MLRAVYLLDVQSEGARCECVSPSRRSLRWLAPVMVAFTLLTATLAPAASGAPGYTLYPGGTALDIPLGNKDGYTAGLSIRRGQVVHFTLEKDGAVVRYTTQGRVSRERILASFGTIGHVDVRLDLSPYPVDPYLGRRCKGRSPLYMKGTYSGSISFPRRTADVPGVSTLGGRVSFVRNFRTVCRKRASKPTRPLLPNLARKTEVGLLTVRARGGGRTVQLDAAIFALKQRPTQSGGGVSAVAYERRGEVRIRRQASLFFGADALVMSRRGIVPESIQIALPKPFSGTALYSRTQDSPPQWTGDLTVDLPGLADVPMAGSGFEAALCRGRIGACFDK